MLQRFLFLFARFKFSKENELNGMMYLVRVTSLRNKTCPPKSAGYFLALSNDTTSIYIAFKWLTGFTPY